MLCESVWKDSQAKMPCHKNGIVFILFFFSTTELRSIVQNGWRRRHSLRKNHIGTKGERDIGSPRKRWLVGGEQNR